MESIQIISIMGASWLVAFIFSYALIYTLTKRWKAWEEMDDSEHSGVLGAFSLGTFPGIIIWWILGTGAFTNSPVLGLFDIPIILLWAVVLMVVAALGGALVIRSEK